MITSRCIGVLECLVTYIREFIDDEKQYEICRANIAVHMDFHVLYFQKVIDNFYEEAKFTHLEYLSNRAGWSRINVRFRV